METRSGPDPEERIDVLLRDLQTGRDGLSGREVERRLFHTGETRSPDARAPVHLRELARQFTHPLAALLWVAALLALAGGMTASSAPGLGRGEDREPGRAARQLRLSVKQPADLLGVGVVRIGV